jgi:hypothetical protein
MPDFVGEGGLITALHFYDKCSSKQITVKKEKIMAKLGKIL